MKKYLLTGMTALSMCAAFTSCSHDDDFYTSLQDSKSAEYQEAFVRAFGEIASNQDWGFGASNVTRSDDPDANMWGGQGAENSRYPQFTVPDTLTTAQKDVVRRWFQTHKNPDNTAITFTNFFVQQVYKGGTNLVSVPI